MSSIETITTRRRGRTIHVGILLGMQLLLSNHHVAVAVDTSATTTDSHLELKETTLEVIDYVSLGVVGRRQLQKIPGMEDIENITIAGSSDLQKIYALAQEMAARDTPKPVATPPRATAAPTTTVQLTTTAHPSSSSPVVVTSPTLAPVVAPSLLSSSSTPTQRPAGQPTHSSPTLSPQVSVPPAKTPTAQSTTAAPIVKPEGPSSSSKAPSNVVPTSASSQVPITTPSSSPFAQLSSASPSDVPSLSPSGTPSAVIPGSTVASTTPSLQPSTVPLGHTPSSSALGSDAPSLTPSITPSSLLGAHSTASKPVTGNSSFFSNSSSTSILSCPKAATNEPIVLPYIYSMETDIHYDVGSVRLSLEEILNIDLAPMLLVCATARSRHLISQSGIVAIDWHPLDIQSANLKCSAQSPNDVCNVFLGKMTVYVSNNTSLYNIADQVKNAIEAVFRVIVVAGLVKVTYLGADQLSAASALDGTNSTGNANPVISNGNLGPSAIILFTTGSAALVAAMGVLGYLRQKRAARADTSGAATQAAGTDTASAEYYNSRRPTSPFSEMLPSAYRFDHDMNMSAILETDEESQARSELLVSEGWVSDNDTTSSIDVPSVNYSRVTATPVLGARKRQSESPVEPFELCSL